MAQWLRELAVLTEDRVHFPAAGNPTPTSWLPLATALTCIYSYTDTLKKISE